MGIFDHLLFRFGKVLHVKRKIINAGHNHLDHVFFSWFTYEPRCKKKTVFGVSDQVRHKPACAVTEDVFELLDLWSDTNRTVQPQIMARDFKLPI